MHGNGRKRHKGSSDDIPTGQTSYSAFPCQIQQAATRAGIEPKSFCDQGAQVFKVGCESSLTLQEDR
jgi:hypothetical protein